MRENRRLNEALILNWTRSDSMIVDVDLYLGYCVIVKLMTTQVQYVDYGNKGMLKKGQVRHIPVSWVTYMPAQAMPCVLTGSTNQPFLSQNIPTVSECRYFLPSLH